MRHNGGSSRALPLSPTKPRPGFAKNFALIQTQQIAPRQQAPSRPDRLMPDCGAPVTWRHRHKPSRFGANRRGKPPKGPNPVAPPPHRSAKTTSSADWPSRVRVPEQPPQPPWISDADQPTPPPDLHDIQAARGRGVWRPYPWRGPRLKSRHIICAPDIKWRRRNNLERRSRSRNSSSLSMVRERGFWRKSPRRVAARWDGAFRAHGA
jgi:hypothetical protein